MIAVKVAFEAFIICVSKSKIRSNVYFDVKSAISGKVIEIAHRDGDQVHRGEVLARVEPDLNQAQSLAETKNALSAARIRYEVFGPDLWAGSPDAA